MKKILFISLAVILALGAGLIGCEGEGEPEGPVKIGILYPTSGYMAVVGGHCKEGAEFALAQLKADTEAAIGRNITIVWGNSGSDPGTAVDEATRMVEIDKVDMLLGPLIAPCAMSVATYMASAEVPHIKTHPSPVDLALGPFDWTIGAGGTEPAHSTAMARYVYDVLEHDNVVTMTGDWAAGHSFMDAFIDTYEALGGTVDKDVWTTHPVTNFDAYFATLPTADACMAWFDGAEAVAFISQYYNYGVHNNTPLEAVFHGSFFPFWALLGANAVAPGCADAVVVGHHAPTTFAAGLNITATQQFVADYIAWSATNSTPDDTQAGGYIGVQLALAALEVTGGDTTPTALRNALLGMAIESPEGPLTIDPTTRMAIKDMYIIRVDSNMGFPPYVWTPVYVYEKVYPLPPYTPIDEGPL